jgi:hypothetical protein
LRDAFDDAPLTVAHPRATRRSRKTRGGPGAPPRAIPSDRRDRRKAHGAEHARVEREAGRTLGTAGERPRGIFGPVPVSEFAILAGIITLIVGFAIGNPKTQEMGVLICALGVFEVTGREHFSGFRSHTILLAFLPAVIVEVLWAMTIGVPSQRILILVPPIPVFLFCFFLLRRRFELARHKRVVGHG